MGGGGVGRLSWEMRRSFKWGRNRTSRRNAANTVLPLCAEGVGLIERASFYPRRRAFFALKTQLCGMRRQRWRRVFRPIVRLCGWQSWHVTRRRCVHGRRNSGEIRNRGLRFYMWSRCPYLKLKVFRRK